MSNVINSIDNFDFSSLTLGNTQSMQGGGYFTRLLLNDDSFILQTPKCYTKKGMCTTGKKIYSMLPIKSKVALSDHKCFLYDSIIAGLCSSKTPTIIGGGFIN